MQGSSSSNLRNQAEERFWRYAIAFVEDWALCPFARTSRKEGKIWLDVLPKCNQDDPTLNAQIAQAAQRCSLSKEHDIGFIVLPNLNENYPAWEARVQNLRTDLLRCNGPTLQPSEWALTAFHPQIPKKLNSTYATTLLCRATPDPTLQMIRLKTLDHVRNQAHRSPQTQSTIDQDCPYGAQSRAHASPALHERIAHHNHQKLCSAGMEKILLQLDLLQS